MDCFRYALEESKAPLCYNGSLSSREQLQSFSQDYPTVTAIMLGRGLIADPGMLTPTGTTSTVLARFHDELLEEYIRAFGGTRNAMFRMKENWRFWLCKFKDAEALGKRLRKTTDETEYRAITREIFTSLPLREDVLPDWD
jgi:tRNA-dihydrouridine synthase